MLFSATIDADVEKLARAYLTEPQIVNANRGPQLFRKLNRLSTGYTITEAGYAAYASS